jgi:hypothetical protein
MKWLIREMAASSTHSVVTEFIRSMVFDGFNASECWSHHHPQLPPWIWKIKEGQSQLLNTSCEKENGSPFLKTANDYREYRHGYQKGSSQACKYVSEKTSTNMSMLCVASKYSTKKEQSLLIDKKKKFNTRKKQIIIK